MENTEKQLEERIKQIDIEIQKLESLRDSSLNLLFEQIKGLNKTLSDTRSYNLTLI